MEIDVPAEPHLSGEFIEYDVNNRTPPSPRTLMPTPTPALALGFDGARDIYRCRNANERSATNADGIPVYGDENSMDPDPTPDLYLRLYRD